MCRGGTPTWVVGLAHRWSRTEMPWLLPPWALRMQNFMKPLSAREAMVSIMSSRCVSEVAESVPGNLMWCCELQAAGAW